MYEGSRSNAGERCIKLVMPRIHTAPSFTTRYGNTCEVLPTVDDREVVPAWRNWQTRAPHTRLGRLPVRVELR